MTWLKRHFLKKISTDIYEILATDVKLTLGKVPKVLRRYLLPFLSYQENPAGWGRIYLPRGLHVKKWQIFAIFSVKKVIYRADGGALYIFPFFAGLGGSSVLGWIFYLLTVTLAYKQALDHFKIFATLSFLTSWPWMAMTWHEITTGSYVSHTRFTLFHQPCFRLKRLLCTGKRAMTNSQKSDLWPDPWRYQRPPSDEVYQNMRRKVMYGEMKFRLRI